MPDPAVLKRLFDYKAWANAGLLTAMTRLDPAASATEIAIRALAHTLLVDQIFIAHMTGSGQGPDATNVAQAPSLEALSEAMGAGDRACADLVATLGPEDLAEPIDFAFTDGAPGRMSREEMLMHLIVHGAYHRGQVGWILTLNGVAPPPDGLTGYLHVAEGPARRRG